MTRIRTVLFWVLACALVVAHAIVAWHSLVVARFWEDEAFNLTVPLNMLRGLGYSSDGALSGSTITPFDPRISTGAAVLLPVTAVLSLGVDPVIGARLVPLAFWMLLLSGLAVLGRRIGGRWAALVAVAVPLAFNSAYTASPIQGPADFLGEIPAAALIVWALVVLHRRPWLAGLLLGLAVQAKLVALLALPAFAVALWLLSPGSGAQRLLTTVRRSVLPLVLVAAPTLLLEVTALVSLGIDGYVEHLRALKWFVLDGGQNYAPTTATEKFGTLVGAWYVPWWAALALALVAAGLIGGGLLSARRAGGRIDVSALALTSAAATGLVAYVAWWSTASHLPLWVRHPSPGVFAFIPLLSAAAVWGARMLWRSHSRGRAVLRLSAAAGIAAVTLGIAASGAAHVAATLAPSTIETLDSQRAAVAPIRSWVQQNDVAWIAAQPWGSATSAVVLAGAHVGLADAPAMSSTPRLTVGAPCSREPIVDGPVYRVCAP